MEEFEMEEFADDAVEEFRFFIETESQFIDAEHDLYTKLLSWSYVGGHLDERIPESMKNLHALNVQVSEKLLELRDLVESGKFQNLSFVAEEKKLVKGLSDKIRDKDWKAVKKGLNETAIEQEQILRLQEKELKELHTLFIEIMKLMKRSNLVEAIEEDLGEVKEKEKYVKLEEYYFVQIYKFIKAYERIFRNLWRKERALATQMKTDSKKI